MKVNGQLKNAQLELVNAKPVATDGCKGQMVYQCGPAPTENKVWVHDGSNWQLISGFPMFSMTQFDNNFFSITTSDSVWTPVFYQGTVREVCSIGAANPGTGEYCAPFDGIIQFNWKGEVLTDDDSDINSRSQVFFRITVNGVEALAANAGALSESVNNFPADQQYLIAFSGSNQIAVSAGDKIRLEVRYFNNFFTILEGFVADAAFEGHYIQAQC